MTEHQFDEQFRQRLGNYSSPVPDNFWERVQPQKDKDQKGLFFWFRNLILPGLLLACLTAVYFINIRPGDHSLQTTGSQSATPSPATTSAHPNTDTRSTIDNRSTGDAHPNTDTHSIRNARSTGDALSATTHSSNNSSSALTTHPIQETHTAIHANTNTGTTSAVHSTARHSINNQPEPSSHKPRVGSSVSVSYTTTSSSHHAESVSGLSVTPSDPLHDLSPKPSRFPADQPITRGSLLPGLQPIPHALGHLSAKLPVTPSPITPQKDSTIRSSRWYLDVYASPDLPIPSGALANSQKASFSYTLGLRLTRSFGQHFSGSIGLQYGRINTHTTSQDSGFLPINRHFKSSSFDIPVLIGYQIKKEHLLVAIHTGIIFNAYTFGDLYKHHTGLSLYLGVNMVEKINDRLSFFTEPYYRYRLSNMLDPSWYFHQKIDIARLSAGIRYHLKKTKPHK